MNKRYLEVETPILQSIPGGATARPFITHHNALNIPLYFRVANELYLKRLIVGGFDGVYEFAKALEMKEWTEPIILNLHMVELYVAYKDYFWMMETTENLLEKISIELNGTSKVKIGDNTD